MKKSCFLLFVFFFFNMNLAVADYIFAPLPVENERQTILKSKKFVGELTTLLGEPVTVKYYPSYDEILTAFVEGEIDFAELGPFSCLVPKSYSQDLA